MFCFSRANHVQNSTSLLYLPIPLSAESWKIFTNKLCQFCFRLSWHFKREKSVFWKHLFAKQELITRAKLRVQDFATGKNFSFNQCHNKAFCALRFSLVRISLLISAITKCFAFFSGTLFYESNRKLFSCVCIAWYKHSRGWENSNETKSRVCITVSNSPNPSCVYIRLCKHGKRFLLLKWGSVLARSPSVSFS